MKKPNNYYCHRTISDDLVPLLSNKLEIIEKIGEGSFGQVYKVFDPRTSSLVVLKKLKQEAILTQEARILSELSNIECFDGLKTLSNYQQTASSFPSSLDQKEIVMGYLGPNTGSIMKKIKKMNIYSMKKIAYQILKKLAEIHRRQYVHRDIKPENIVLGNKSNSHSAYLIDFGLVCSYRKNSSKVRKTMEGIVGTVKYCPISSHLGLQQYPKDDLQSLGYVLLYYVTGSLPWQKILDINDKSFSKIMDRKKECSIQDLCSGVNCLRKYWKKIKGLSHNDTIDYDELTEIFDVDDRKGQNCFQFCENCWVRTKQTEQKENDLMIKSEPKSSKIRSSILN